MSEHLSHDEVADLDEGLLDPDAAAAARRHLSACAECSGRARELVSVREQLRAAGPVRIPEDVAARIERALTAEGSSSATVVPDLPRIPRRRVAMPTLAASVAAAVLALAIGAVVVGHYRHGSTPGTSTAATADGGVPAAAGGSGASSAPLLVTATGRTYTQATLTRAVPSLVSGSNAAPSPGFAQPLASQPGVAPTAAPRQPVNHGAPGTRADRKHAATAGKGSGKGSGGAVAASPTATPGNLQSLTTLSRVAPVPKALAALHTSRSKLLACASTLRTPENPVPLAVDFGRWTDGSTHGAPSAIFVFDHPGDSSLVDVYVVDPTCSGVHQVRKFFTAPAS